VAVKVFGLDVGGSSGSSNYDNNSRGRGSRGKSSKNNRSNSARSTDERNTSGSSLTSGVAGLLNGVLGGSSDSEGSDDGLIDVWFERKGGKKKRNN
jgi:hypothetical protein